MYINIIYINFKLRVLLIILIQNQDNLTYTQGSDNRNFSHRIIS